MERMNRRFLFPQREYNKYYKFDAMDKVFDVDTTTWISKDLKVMLRDAYDMTERIDLVHEDTKYASATGYYAFY